MLDRDDLDDSGGFVDGIDDAVAAAVAIFSGSLARSRRAVGDQAIS